MIAQQLEPVCGVERRLRDIPQLSFQPAGSQFYSSGNNCNSNCFRCILMRKLSHCFDVDEGVLGAVHCLIPTALPDIHRLSGALNSCNSSKSRKCIKLVEPPPCFLNRDSQINHCNYATRQSAGLVQVPRNKFHNEKNRPFFNPSRGRSDRQGGRWGDHYRR